NHYRKFEIQYLSWGMGLFRICFFVLRICFEFRTSSFEFRDKAPTVANQKRKAGHASHTLPFVNQLSPPVAALGHPGFAIRHRYSAPSVCGAKPSLRPPSRQKMIGSMP